MRDDQRRGQPSRPGFLLPVGHRRLLLGSSFSRWGVGLFLRSAYRSLLPGAGPHRGLTFHTYELRPGWVPSRPRGRRCLHGWLRISSRRLPHPSGNVPTPRCCFNRPRLDVTRHHRGFTCVHPSGFSLACSPGWNGEPWASPWSFAPRRHQRHTSGWGQALSTGPRLRSRHHQSTLLSASPLATCDLVSHFWRVAPYRFEDAVRRIGRRLG